MVEINAASTDPTQVKHLYLRVMVIMCWKSLQHLSFYSIYGSVYGSFIFMHVVNSKVGCNPASVGSSSEPL